MKIWIDRDRTLAARESDDAADLVGTFVESFPLYRIVDGEELARIVRRQRVLGGFFATKSERAYGASWTASLEGLVSWGRGWQGARLGKDLFVLEIDAELRLFYHMAHESLKSLLDPTGPPSQEADVSASICNTGLGCSLHDVGLHELTRIYRVTKNDEIVPLSYDDLYAYVEARPRKDIDLRAIAAGIYYGGTIHGVDVALWLDQNQFRPGMYPYRKMLEAGTYPHRDRYGNILPEAYNPHYRLWQIATRDERPIVVGGKTRKAAIDAAARVLEGGRIPEGPPLNLSPPKRSKRHPALDLRGRPLRYRDNPTFSPLTFTQEPSEPYSAWSTFRFEYRDEPYFVVFGPAVQPVPIDVRSGDSHVLAYKTVRGFAVSFYRESDEEREDNEYGDIGLGKYGMTGDGGAIPVLGTVMEIMRSFIAEHHPAFLMFTADNLEPSRIRLYSRLVRTMKIRGYEQGHHMLTAGRYDASQFYLVRSDIVESLIAERTKLLQETP